MTNARRIQDTTFIIVFSSRERLAVRRRRFVAAAEEDKVSFIMDRVHKYI